MTRRFRFCLLLAVALVSILGISATHARQGSSPLASDFDAVPAMEWMNLAYDRIQADEVNAPAVSRLYAYAAITLYESVVDGIPDNLSLGGQLNELPALPLPSASEVYDWHAVSDAALLTVLREIFSGFPDSVAAFADLHDQHLEARTAATSPDVAASSVEYGHTLGAALLEWMAGDHFAERSLGYTFPENDPSTWVMTDDSPDPVEPDWGSIRTLYLPEATRCDIDNDVAFSTDEGSVFFAQAMEVFEVGNRLTQEEKDIAEFWIDTPGQTGAPTGHWIHIAGDLILQEGLMLDRAAELYVLVAMALMDANIATWNYKYAYPLIRPVTYIRETISRRWQSYLETPMFPEYPSGHSVVSGTAAAILTHYFGGPRAFTNTNITPSGLQTRTFTSFWAAAQEGAISRMYGGIHYRAAIENGVEMGRCIGTYLAEHVRLR
ncbi:MAG: vanadium-dependent haloperoxidase [Chloroflexi bacterium]|nr:vanadium-dependent haloperoxidase [Chloroflexota bacterium]